MARPPVISQLWQLAPYANMNPVFRYVVMTPEPIEHSIVIAAWAYALRHTAKGLDLPDHEAALELLLERHPSWQVIEGQVVNVPVQLAVADNDEPETSS
ncbi:MAG: hypothetical protein WBC91_19600 [Phototrophicaceae bacterium]